MSVASLFLINALVERLENCGCMTGLLGYTLDWGSMERYAQQGERRGLFINMTTVLPLLGLVGTTRGFFGSDEPIGDRSVLPRDLRNGKTAV